MTVAFEREGARLGGCTATTIAMVTRIDASAVTGTPVISIEVTKVSSFSSIAGTVTVGVPVSGNNYQDTCYVSGLTAGTKYFWRAKISDDDGTVYGDEQSRSELFSGEFRTLPTNTVKPWRALLTGCIQGRQIANGGEQTVRASFTAQNITAKLKPDYIFMIGDIYYSDVGGSNRDVNGADNWTDDATDAYQPRAWYDQNGAVATDITDFTLAKSRTNFITSMDAAIVQDKPYGYSSVFTIPTYYMWDDHDHGWDNCSGQAGDVDGTPAGTFWGTRRDRAHQVGHECFMDLNKQLINQESGRDFDVEANGDSVDPEEFYYVDIAPVRFIVLDTRALRDERTATDTSSKSMLNGADVTGQTVEQKQWLKDRIDDNDQKYLCIVSTVAFDGNHGNPGQLSNWDSWKGFSYERQEIFDYIRSNGNPNRTILLSSDFHSGQVYSYTGADHQKIPIYEFMAANNWYGPAEDTNSGFGVGAANNNAGGRILYTRAKNPTAIVIDAGPFGLRIGLWETLQSSVGSTHSNAKMLFQMDFE